MVDKNDPLLREVDEELRREQWAKLWEQYGIYVISAAALIVALVGGFKYWESRKVALAEAGGAQYEAALSLLASGKTEEAVKALQSVASGGLWGYASLADLALAGSHLKAGRPKEALAIFERLAGDDEADEALAGFASLQAAALELEAADYTHLQKRLAPLSGDEGPWRYAARELLGTAALKAGKVDQARKVLAPLLADANVPESTRERVHIMMANVASTELTQPGSTPVAPSSPATAPTQN